MASGTDPNRPTSAPLRRPPLRRPLIGRSKPSDPCPGPSASTCRGLLGRTARWALPGQRIRWALLVFSLSTSTALGQEVSEESAQEDVITLAEIVPALEGSELGALAIGPAPAPGTARRVRRTEVVRALARAGRDARGLVIPRSVEVRRTLRALDAEGVDALLRPVLTQALAPCELVGWRGPTRLELGEAAPTIEADIDPPLRAQGSVSGVVRLRQAGREQRVAVRADVRCPEPSVAAGDRVRVVVRIGPVLASAVGVARQPGRVGDVIRVTNEGSRTALLARIVDDETVEVVR